MLKYLDPILLINENIQDWADICRGMFAKKVIGIAFRDFILRLPLQIPEERLLCEEELKGYYFSNSRVHLYDDSLVVQPLSREEYTQTFDYLSWGNWRLNRKTLELENTKLLSTGQCELLSLTGMIDRLAESRQQKMAGNKL